MLPPVAVYFLLVGNPIFLFYLHLRDCFPLQMTGEYVSDVDVSTVPFQWIGYNGKQLFNFAIIVPRFQYLVLKLYTVTGVSFFLALVNLVPFCCNLPLVWFDYF